MYGVVGLHRVILARVDKNVRQLQQERLERRGLQPGRQQMVRPENIKEDTEKTGDTICPKNLIDSLAH